MITSSIPSLSSLSAINQSTFSLLPWRTSLRLPTLCRRCFCESYKPRMFHNEHGQMGDCAPWFSDHFVQLCVDLNFCVCVSFQLAAETADLHGQSVSGLWRRSIGVPLRCRDVWKLQSLLQKSRGRYDIGSGHQTDTQQTTNTQKRSYVRRHHTDRRTKHTIKPMTPTLMKTLHLKSR